MCAPQIMKRTERIHENNLHNLTGKKIKLMDRLKVLAKEIEAGVASGQIQREDVPMDDQGDDEEDGYATDETKSGRNIGPDFTMPTLI